MKTGILTDPYGNSLSTNGFAGLAPAIHANHLYVYDCSENIGATFLKNTGSGVNGNLTFNGTAGIDYILNSERIGKNTKSYRSLLVDATGYVSSGTSCSISGGSVSMEMFTWFDNDALNMTNGNSMWLISSGAADALYFNTQYNNNSPTITLNGVGTFACPEKDGIRSTLNVAAHYLATYDGTTGILKYYVNGLLAGSITVTGGAHAFPTAVQIGFNGYPGSTNSVRGWYTQLRWSNIARSASYAMATANTLLAM